MSEDESDLREGLRMTAPPDPADLEAEIQELARLESGSSWRRWVGYLRMGGPGYLQAALTLGTGTATYALTAGAAYGYRLLWVAPTGMLIGIVMMLAISWQTLSTGQRPFSAMRRYAGPFFAWGWALGAVLASIVWHFPQYSVSAACMADLVDYWGWRAAPQPLLAVFLLIIAVTSALLSARSARSRRAYERFLKWMVWSIVICFGVVVYRTGVSDWSAVFRGYFAFEVPADERGLTTVVSGLSAAVGINMVFLYPYTLLARGWGRAHRNLAQADLLAGMFLPYLIATSLLVIASANTLYPQAAGRLQPADVAQAIAPIIGEGFSRTALNLGVIAMALSSISLHMLCCGFVAVEVFGCAVGSRTWRLATLLPTPGVMGPLVWQHSPVWLGVLTNVICAFFLPVAYLGFFLMQRRRDYLKDAMPQGWRGRLWLGAMAAVILLLLFFLWRLLREKVFGA
ncbi:MAG: divalent metal cation transporter [Planctomycetes bacterium]|nr:divalent metal cation transporter [Planctomycetota bacterium]